MPEDALRGALEAAVGHEQARLIIEGKKSVVTSCGSGMTAGVLWLGLSLLGVKSPALYDEVHLLIPGTMVAVANIICHSRGPDMPCDQKAALNETKWAN